LNAGWAAVVLACALGLPAWGAEPVKVGSKRFTESYVLGEIVRETYARAGIAAVHRQGLGNTGILEQALAAGEVDVYPEYTGTIVRELLKRSDQASGNPSLDELNRWLAPRGLKAAVPLGFNNSYALALREADAQRLGLVRMSDLLRPEAATLRWALSHEFLARADGWPALQRAYGYTAAKPSGLDHGLAYGALKAGQIDVIDIYTTDAQIGRLGLRVLQDDRAFFPKYDAVLLMRSTLDTAPLQALAGRIDERRMIELNAQAEIDRIAFVDIARAFLDGQAVPAGSAPAGAAGMGAATAAGNGFLSRLFAPDLARLSLQHLLLVFGSLAAALAVGVPIGIAAWRKPRLAQVMLGVVGLIQTIPSLALLAFLIAALGSIGVLPAMVALFLYALLPIVRNTHAGLQGSSAGIAQAGLSLGLTSSQVLRHVQLPLAMPTLLAGAKTAAIINVGTATMAAFVGAGGFGERIVAGLALNDSTALLAGAVPAAVLAVVVQGGFEWAERRWGVRAGSAS